MERFNRWKHTVLPADKLRTSSVSAAFPLQISPSSSSPFMQTYTDTMSDSLHMFSFQEFEFLRLAFSCRQTLDIIMRKWAVTASFLFF